MTSFTRSFGWAAAAAAALALWSHPTFVAAQSGDHPGESQVERVPADRIPPAPVLRPEEQIKTFKLPAGFRVEVVAAEPLVTSPVSLQFDAQGRLWVLEMNGYMPNQEGIGEQEPTGTVAILEDQDGDGRMDHRTVFLDRLVMPRSLMLFRDGALIAEPPIVWFARDTNGDGRADEKTVAFTDYATQNDPKLGLRSNPEHASNSLLWTLDNWIYSANHTTRYRNVDGVWKSEPTIFRGQWGLAQDDSGRLYYNSNSDPLRADFVPSRYLARNANLRSPYGANVGLAPDLRVWPARVNPGVNRGYQPGQLTPEGRLATFTGACGPAVYRGNQFPAEYLGNAFICEPTANLVRRYVISDHDGELAARNPYPQDEFLTSTDERFRPVNLANGPDGCLYVVDFARGLIQHRIYLTTYLRRQIESRQLQAPVNLGRIYRIVHEASKRSPETLPAQVTSAEWLRRLNHPNGWWRDRAQQTLVERHDLDIVPALRRQVDARENPSELGRLHALWTLEGLGQIDLPTLERAVDDPKVKVRRGALQLCETFLGTEERDEVVNLMLRRAGSGPLEEQLQLLLTLGEVATPATDTILRLLLMNGPATPLRFHAAISGLGGRELEFLEALLNDPICAAAKQDHAPLLTTLARAVVQERRSARIGQLLQLAGFRAPGDWQQLAVLDGLASAVPQPTKANPNPTLKPIRFEVEPKGLAQLRQRAHSNVVSRLPSLERLIVWRGKPGWVEPPPPPPLSPEEERRFQRGAEHFRTVCAPCHQPHGLGQEGLAPPLADSEWVLGSPARLARIILHGLRDGIVVKGQRWDLNMPALGTALDDAQIAEVLTYLRREWEHSAQPIAPEFVQGIRESTRSRADAWTATELEAVP